MSIGGRTGGKHWTAAQVQAREAAAGQARRATRVSLKAPQWVKDNPVVLAVWKDVVKKLRGIELLDNIDAELLALYCDAIVHYRDCTRRLGMPVHTEDDEKPAPVDDLIKATQAWARIVATFADKLGLTPGGRARLAKKKAEQIVDEFADKFGG
jgi:P27 family predicted phage terminase small subunit